MSETRWFQGDDLHTIARKILTGLNEGRFLVGGYNGNYQVVGQDTPANLQSQVSQPNATALNSTVAQPLAANLNATVVQSTPANLHATVVQSTPGSLNATVVQSVAASLNATVVGNVGGYAAMIKDAPTLSLLQYATGTSIGGKRTLLNAVKTPGGTGVLQSLTIVDRSNHLGPLTIFIFDSDIPVSAPVDRTVFSFGTDDTKLIAQVNILANEFITTGNKGIYHKGSLGIVLKAASGTTLYAVLVAKANVTFLTSSDVQLSFGIRQD